MDKDDPRFDVVLDMEDKDFAEKLIKAIGIEQGDTIRIMTPQFDRLDGKKVKYFPKTVEEYEFIKELSEQNLKKLGCQIWNKENGKVHWLYPTEWYNHIPDGVEIIDISGNKEIFKHGETDDDMRYGALAYGFIQYNGACEVE